MSALGVPLTCPHCGARLIYERTERETKLYACDRHGLLVLTPDGRLQMVSVYNSERRAPA